MTEQLKLSPEVIALGKALVSLFAEERQGRDDLLSKWMAHDLASKIVAAEADPSNDQIRRDCAKAILELWEHRAVFPHEKRPSERYESVLQTLERLDPAQAQSFFLPETIRATQGEGTWLNAAISFDKTARLMITYVLGQAAAHAEAGVDWGALASAAKLPAAPDLAVLRRLLTRSGREVLDGSSAERSRLKGLLSELATFQKISRQIANALRADLEALDQSEASERDGGVT